MARASELVRTSIKIAAIGAAVVLVFSVSRGPRLPAIEAPAQAAAEPRLPVPRLIGEADAAAAPAAKHVRSEPVTIGPDEAIRMHGGSVVTDFFSQ
jgi:hypothetical protein